MFGKKQFHILHLLAHAYGPEEVEEITGYVLSPYDSEIEYYKFNSFKWAGKPLPTTLCGKDFTVLEASFMDLSDETVEAKYLEIGKYKRSKNFTIPIDVVFPDLLFWARYSTWSPLQACCLSMGMSPSLDMLNHINNLFSKEYIGAHFEELRNRLLILNSAIGAGKVSGQHKPEEYVKYLSNLDFEFPESFVEKVIKYQSDGDFPRALMPSMQFREIEKKSLLKLIAAMSIKGYGFNPNKSRNLATSDIESDLDLLGLHLDQKTILKWLREATELIDNKDVT